MSLLELFLLAVGLSMDAFAVAVCKGLAMPRISWREMAAVGLWFGGFQALMPLLGWLLGTTFQQYIASVDHWIAFGLLVFIGVNMLREAFSEEDGGDSASFHWRVMLVMAVATSIDALAVGVTFAFLQVRAGLAAAAIGVTTFLLSAAGVRVGSVFGARWRRRAQVLGGVILMLLGTKILLEHLNVLG